MKKVILLTVFTFLFSLGFSFAEVPCKINYQGRLIKDGVPVNGTVNMEFKLYDQPTGGNLKKTITLTSVSVYNGLFRAVLDLEGIDWTAGQTIYLEVKVGTDVLSPREEIYAYPYAINTRFLEGKAKDYFINTSADTQRKDGGLNIMGDVGIGTASPGAKLEVAGQIKITGGSPAAGKVLTSDVSGLASWQAPAAGGGGAYGMAYRTSKYTTPITSQWFDLPLEANSDLVNVTHSTTVNPARVTVNVAGTYLIHYYVYIGGWINTNTRTRLYKNGVSDILGSYGEAEPDAESVSNQIITSLSANDYITLQFYTAVTEHNVMRVTLTVVKIGP